MESPRTAPRAWVFCADVSCKKNVKCPHRIHKGQHATGGVFPKQPCGMCGEGIIEWKDGATQHACIKCGVAIHAWHFSDDDSGMYECGACRTTQDTHTPQLNATPTPPTDSEDTRSGQEEEEEEEEGDATAIARARAARVATLATEIKNIRGDFSFKPVRKPPAAAAADVHGLDAEAAEVAGAEAAAAEAAAAEAAAAEAAAAEAAAAEAAEAAGAEAAGEEAAGEEAAEAAGAEAAGAEAAGAPTQEVEVDEQAAGTEAASTPTQEVEVGEQAAGTEAAKSEAAGEKAAEAEAAGEQAAGALNVSDIGQERQLEFMFDTVDNRNAEAAGYRVRKIQLEKHIGYIACSVLHRAGKGVYAGETIKKGETVETLALVPADGPHDIPWTFKEADRYWKPKNSTDVGCLFNDPWADPDCSTIELRDLAQNMTTTFEDGAEDPENEAFLTFKTKKQVEAMEELVWSYGEDFDSFFNDCKVNMFCFANNIQIEAPFEWDDLLNIIPWNDEHLPKELQSITRTVCQLKSWFQNATTHMQCYTLHIRPKLNVQHVMAGFLLMQADVDAHVGNILFFHVADQYRGHYLGHELVRTTMEICYENPEKTNNLQTLRVVKDKLGNATNIFTQLQFITSTETAESQCFEFTLPDKKTMAITFPAEGYEDNGADLLNAVLPICPDDECMNALIAGELPPTTCLASKTKKDVLHVYCAKGHQITMCTVITVQCAHVVVDGCLPWSSTLQDCPMVDMHADLPTFSFNGQSIKFHRFIHNEYRSKADIVRSFGEIVTHLRSRKKDKTDHGDGSHFLVVCKSETCPAGTGEAKRKHQYGKSNLLVVAIKNYQPDKPLDLSDERGFIVRTADCTPVSKWRLEVPMSSSDTKEITEHIAECFVHICKALNALNDAWNGHYQPDNYKTSTGASTGGVHSVRDGRGGGRGSARGGGRGAAGVTTRETRSAALGSRKTGAAACVQG